MQTIALNMPLICLPGSRSMSLTLRLHIYGRYVDYSVDHDSRIVPHRDPRNRSLYQLLHSQYVDVRRFTKLQKFTRFSGRYVFSVSRETLYFPYRFSYLFIPIITGSHAVQWFFAGVSITAVVFVWLLLPETHGKKLSEIEEYFHNHFLAVGAESKSKKRRVQRRKQRNNKSSATEPLNPKTMQNV